MHTSAFHLIRFCFLLMILTVGVVFDTVSQTSIGSWIYYVEQDTAEFRVIRTTGEEREVVTIMPAQSSEALFAIASEDEIEQARRFYSTTPFGSVPGFTPQQIEEILNNPNLTSAIVDIAVAPDNEALALNVQHTKCSSPQFRRCFGVNQVIIWENNTQRVVFETGLNSAEYLPGRLGGVAQDVYIREMRWLPDQTGLVIALSDDYVRTSPGNISLIVVPVTGSGQPFPLGEGAIWTIDPNSRRVAAIGAWPRTNTLTFFSFDLETGPRSEEVISLGTYVTLYPFGMAYNGNHLIFHINHDDAAGERVAEGDFGTVLYEPGSGLPLTLTDLGLGVRLGSIQSTPPGSHTVIQTADGLLWNTEIVDGNLSLVPLSRTPVDFWLLGASGEILAQPQGRETLQILTQAGEIREAEISDVRVPQRGLTLYSPGAPDALVVTIDW